MTRSLSSGVVVLLIALSTAVPAHAAEQGLGGLITGSPIAGCSVTHGITIPSDAIATDLPNRLPYPLFPSPSLLARDAEGHRGVRFQQVFSSHLFSQPVTLTGMRFRLDAMTPLSSLSGDLSFVLTLRISSFHGSLDAVSPRFEDNLLSTPIQAFDGVVTVGGTAETREITSSPDGQAPLGDELAIIFKQPVPYDPASGQLLIDIQIRGFFGNDLTFAHDGATPHDQAVSVLSLEANAPRGDVIPGGPVVTFDAVAGALTLDFVERCFDALPLPRRLEVPLIAHLEAAMRHGAAGRDRRADRQLQAYIRTLERFAASGQLNEDTAALLRQLGAEAAFGIATTPALFETARSLTLDSRYGLALFGVDQMVGPSFPANHPAQIALGDVADLSILLFFEAQEFSGREQAIQEILDALKQKLADLIAQAREMGLKPEVITLLEDLIKTLEDPALVNKLVDALAQIGRNGTLDKGDLDALKAIKEVLTALIKKLGEESDLAKGLAFLKTFLCGVGAYLDSGDLVSVSFTFEQGKTLLTIKVAKPIQILLFSVDVNIPGYGTTTFRLYMTIKKDVTIAFCKDGGKFVIDPEPNDAIDLDLDSTGWFVVLYLESLVGFDLDNFCLSDITVEEGKMIIQGTADGDGVRIIIDGGVRVLVNGMQVYPASP